MKEYVKGKKETHWGIPDFGFYNNDCMDVFPAFPDNYFDLAIVDPPYGGVTQGGYMKNQSRGGVAEHPDYHLSLWSQDKPPKEYFDQLFRVSKNQIIWGGNYFTTLINKDSQCWIVWDKEKPAGIKYADAELAWTSFDVATKMFRYAWNRMIQGDMKHKETKIHPTQKPVNLYLWLLKEFAKPGDIILDTHVGSASSLVACEKAGFKYVGFEIDQTYYEAAKRRLDAEKGQFKLWDYIDKDGVYHSTEEIMGYTE